MKQSSSQSPSQSRRAGRPAAQPGKSKRSRADHATAKHLLAMLKAGSDTRIKKVKRIRQSVRTRSYENELKLSIALERMVREMSA